MKKLYLIMIILILISGLSCDPDYGTSKVRIYNASGINTAYDLKVGDEEFNNVKKGKYSAYQKMSVGTFRITGYLTPQTTNIVKDLSTDTPLDKTSIKVDANRVYTIKITRGASTTVIRDW